MVIPVFGGWWWFIISFTIFNAHPDQVNRDGHTKAKVNKSHVKARLAVYDTRDESLHWKRTRGK